MEKRLNTHNPNFRKTSRRNFFSSIATGAAAVSAASLTPLTAGAKTFSDEIDNPDAAEAWFNQLTGKHKMVFDVTQPHDVLPFAWPRVFLVTNGITSAAEKEKSVVVILRHDAIPYAMDTPLWAKYKFGDVFKVTDPMTKASSVRNPFWKPKPGDFKVPGLGNVAIGINELQESGVMFGVCATAMTVYSAAVAEGLKKDGAEIKKEWIAGLLPGIQVVPSGVWAIGRAQEHGCGYCFAG